VIPSPSITLSPLLPEIVLALTGILVLLLDAIVGSRRSQATMQRTLALITAAGICIAIACTLFLWDWTGRSAVLGGMVAVDKFTVFGRTLVLVVSLAATIFGYQYFKDSREARGEFYPLLLFATLGMTLMTASADLIIVFLSLEILSLALYVLSGFSFRRASGEASMKYFLLGAFSSAFFLYGVAMTYGATGTTSITGIVHALTGTPNPNGLAYIAIALLAIGFAFKIAAVPFHMWTPDVYQGAPTPVVGFMAAGTKIAAFCALIRVLDVAFQPLTWNWRPVIWILAAITMVTGSILAIAQSNIKRMLAYSSIATAGFILVGLSAGNAQGIGSVLFYLTAYALMIVGAFGVVMLISGGTAEHSSLSSFKGLAKTNPAMAGVLTVFLVSLAGVPPTAGFMAKVAVFQAAVNTGGTWVVLVAVLASVAAAFFYLRVVVLMYMHEPEGGSSQTATQLPASRLSSAVLFGAAGLIIVFGVVPGIVFGLLEQASVLKW
jgi:NADH-quinone oxidoreductase subunit N